MDYHKSYFKYSPINNLEEALDWLITKKRMSKPNYYIIINLWFSLF